MDDSLINFNHQIVQSENQEIDDFILRYHWKMNTTPTGLRFMIYKKGNGISAEKGNIVTLQYTLKKLTGDLVYATVPGHPVELEIGRHELNNGLEEGVLMMKTGERAKFILPSHLAYGLLGDLDKIPLRTILVYDVELLDVKQGKK
ncbi:MAG: FKBP-type peptidyl-prolyl cis-trans isomerase [Bacteroidales bacterium]|jgi:FKBP-type peptidyl-prolyl cis-trans isomerase|nr:FKBP-type peptidyl-prolyl cis-trans isomerase [Bacteroidales bacterium]